MIISALSLSVNNLINWLMVVDGRGGRGGVVGGGGSLAKYLFLYGQPYTSTTLVNGIGFDKDTLRSSLKKSVEAEYIFSTKLRILTVV